MMHIVGSFHHERIPSVFIQHLISLLFQPTGDTFSDIYLSSFKCVIFKPILRDWLFYTSDESALTNDAWSQWISSYFCFYPPSGIIYAMWLKEVQACALVIICICHKIYTIPLLEWLWLQCQHISIDISYFCLCLIIYPMELGLHFCRFNSIHYAISQQISMTKIANAA